MYVFIHLLLYMKSLPVLQCENCSGYLLDDPVMGRVEEIFEKVNAAAELENHPICRLGSFSYVYTLWRISEGQRAGAPVLEARGILSGYCLTSGDSALEFIESHHHSRHPHFRRLASS
jgi:hypothetical protein